MIVGGYRVPKDTPVQLPPYSMHLSSANFVQPDKFWPERWAQQMPAFSPDKGMLLCLGQKGKEKQECAFQRQFNKKPSPVCCPAWDIPLVFKLGVCLCGAVLVVVPAIWQHHVTGLCLYLRLALCSDARH